MSSNFTALEGQLCPLVEKMRKHGGNNNTQINVAVISIHGLVSCLGILENILIIWVVGFRLKKYTVASIWVLNLAISDFLATLTLPLFTIYLYSSNSWELGEILCKGQSSIFFLNMFVSAFLLAAISLDRLLLVAKPAWCQNHRSVAGAWKVCALGWLWAALNTLPYTLFRKVIRKADGKKLCYHNFALFSSPPALQRDCNALQASTAISKLLVAFLVPLVVIAGSYIKIASSLRSRDIRRKQSTMSLAQPTIQSSEYQELAVRKKETFVHKSRKTDSTLRSEVYSPTTLGRPYQRLLSQSFIKMVSSVIAAFALCWAPYHIICVIEMMAQFKEDRLKLVETWLPLSATLSFLNPILNPILYVFSCPHFCVRIRHSLGALFDGLVEEQDGLSSVPGRSIKFYIRRKSSGNASLALPCSPEELCHSPDLLIPFQHLTDLKDNHVDDLA